MVAIISGIPGFGSLGSSTLANPWSSKHANSRRVEINNFYDQTTGWF
jgi:hypothetical protein